MRFPQPLPVRDGKELSAIYGYLQRLPDIQSKLQKDVRLPMTILRTNLEEIILVSGVYAITVHRLAHEFHRWVWSYSGS